MDVDTLVRHKLPVVMVVGNNSAWGLEKHPMRLLHQYECSKQGVAMNNHINPKQLNDLDRRILKEAFRQSRKIQSRLAMEYDL